MALLELAARVEALTGPDRGVDALITEERGWKVRYDGADPSDRTPYYLPDPDRSWTAVPQYTFSLDAAMMLVPEGSFWRLGHDGDGADPSEFRAQVIVPKLGGKDPQGIATASTPALALTAACLKARAEFGNIGADGVQS